MERNENQKDNNGIIIVLLTIIIIILIALCILFATGTISLKSKTVNNDTSNSGNSGTEIINNGNNDSATNNIETTILTNAEAAEIVKNLYNDAVRYIYNQATAYCGEGSNGSDGYITIDGFGYAKSANFSNLEELEDYLKKYMTKELLSSTNYKKSVTINGKTITSYIERDGALYCNGWNKGGNMGLYYYDEDNTTYEINNITSTSFNAKIDAVYYDYSYVEDRNNSVRTLKEINVTVIKKNGNWLLDKYEERIIN